MMVIRVSLLLAIYGISCCYSLRLYRSPSALQDASDEDVSDKDASDRDASDGDASDGDASDSQPDNDGGLSGKYFEQEVTHFDETDTRKWQQGYYQDDTYYKQGGPAYLWIEGTDFPFPFRVMKGYWVDHAKKHKAMLFSISHRFHYLSQIMRNTTVQNLAYLTVPEVLADYAAFIKGTNELHEFPQNTKWIIFGSSYGGNLAAWMRSSYPKLVHGAVASSAPVLAKMDFTEYLDNVESSIESFNRKCRKDIALANEKLDELVETENGRKEIEETFKLCDPLDGTSLSTSTFMDDMTSYLAFDIERDLENNRLKQSCDTMLENAASKTPVQRYAQLMNKYLKEFKTKCIVSNFDALVDPLRKVDAFSSFLSGRSWYYQLCTSFGWFQVTSPKSTTFSKNINSEFYVQLCSKIFKPSFDKKFISQSVDKTNKLFGGQRFNTPRTLFVHGTMDPWRNLGITSTKNNRNVEVILIKGGTHATDSAYEHLFSKHHERKVAIDKIMATLDSWLKK